MLDTVVSSNENRQFAFRRKEATASIGGGGCHVVNTALFVALFTSAPPLRPPLSSALILRTSFSRPRFFLSIFRS